MPSLFQRFTNLFRKPVMSITTENLTAAVDTIVAAVKAGYERETALTAQVAEKDAVIATQAATIAADELEINAAAEKLKAALVAPAVAPAA